LQTEKSTGDEADPDVKHDRAIAQTKRIETRESMKLDVVQEPEKLGSFNKSLKAKQKITKLQNSRRGAKQRYNQTLMNKITRKLS